MDLSIYEKLGFKLFLCDENKKALVEWKDPKNHLTIAEAEQFQQEEGFLIGAWIPPTVRVIDLDRHPDKPDGFKEFNRIAQQYKFSIQELLEKTFCVKTAGKGLHLYFLKSSVEPQNKDVAPGIENRGVSNHYVIAAGSKGYVPVNGVTDVIEFPEGMKAWLKDADTPKKRPNKKRKLSAPPIELLAEVLSQVSAFNFASNDRWFQFITSCVTVFGETNEVYDQLEAWSKTDPKYTRDATIRKRIESITANKDNGIGVGTFFMLIEEEGITDTLLKKLRRILDEGDPSTALALTDVGNGYAFVSDHGDKVRFCTKFEDGRGAGWLYFDGKRWVRDYAQIIPGLAKQTLRGLWNIAYDTKDGALSKHVLRTGSNGKIYAMLNQAKSVKGIPVDPKEFDTDPWLLNVQNGTIDLRSGALLAQSKEDLITKICNVDYDPVAECPLWKKFLNEILDGNKDMARFLQKLMGYCLTGDMREDMFFFLWGSGCNGKSVLAEIVIFIMGDYAATAMEETFMAKPSGKINSDLERIADKRLIFTSELNKGAKLDESLIKRWTGEDTISVEQKFQIPYDTKPIGKLLFRTNKKPEIEGQDEGIWRRTKLIPFTVSFKDREDKQLKSKLLKEASGILNWLLEGCLMWQKEGLDLPPQVKEASAEYRSEQDVLNEFFETYLEKGDKATYAITVKRCYELYNKYAEFAQGKILSKNNFSIEIKERIGAIGREYVYTPKKEAAYKGIREKKQEEEK